MWSYIFCTKCNRRLHFDQLHYNWRTVIILMHLSHLNSSLWVLIISYRHRFSKFWCKHFFINSNRNSNSCGYKGQITSWNLHNQHHSYSYWRSSDFINSIKHAISPSNNHRCLHYNKCVDDARSTGHRNIRWNWKNIGLKFHHQRWCVNISLYQIRFNKFLRRFCQWIQIRIDFDYYIQTRQR